MVHSTSQGFDGGSVGACALLVDGLTFDSVFLIGNFDGGVVGRAEKVEWGSVGDEQPVGVPEGDILDGEWDSVGFVGARLGVLTNSEEVVEGDVTQVGNSEKAVLLAGWVGAGPSFVEQVFN